MFKRLELNDKINDLEFENARLKQAIQTKNRPDKYQINNLYRIIRYWENKYIELEGNLYDAEVNLDNTKAELTYWKETAKHWKDLNKDAESDLHYWQKYSSNLAETLNNFNKWVDK